MGAKRPDEKGKIVKGEEQSDAAMWAFVKSPLVEDLQHIHPDLRHLARPIERVLKDPANARRHNPRNLAVVKASLAEFGQRDAVKIRRSTGQLEAGEGRLLAALELGWKYIAVLECDDDALTATRYAIADNRSAELATWDDAVLGQQLGALREQDLDLAPLGFDDAEAGRLIGAFDDPGEGKLPDLPEGPPDVRQMTFQLTALQHEIVTKALALAKAAAPDGEKGNPNSAALARVALGFVHAVEGGGDVD